MSNVGKRLKFLREKQGLSVEQLAEKAGISTTTINRIERRGLRPALTTVKALLDALQVEPAELLGFNPPAERIFKEKK